MEVLSIAASVVSIGLAVVAIWLAIAFYRLGNESSSRIQEASKDIAGSVGRLEALFDRMYSDIFGIMRDTVSDMRRHMWPEEQGTDAIGEDAEVNRLADEHARELRGEVADMLAHIAFQGGATDAGLGDLAQRMEPLLDETITRARALESKAQAETIRAAIVRAFRRVAHDGRTALAADLVDQLRDRFGFAAVRRELERMRKDDIIDWDTSDLEPSTTIRWGPAARAPGREPATFRRMVLSAYREIARQTGRKPRMRDLVIALDGKITPEELSCEVQYMRDDEVLHWHTDELEDDTRIERGPAT